ncbi:MAG TPA: lycopene cyclase domain-containing protein [Polyangiaceae bacterium]|nr:lycopene cyclase domain-containing protein [Polyangiaceae bacterium]
MRWLYLALDLGALLGPLALSFDRKVAFYRNYRHLLPAIGVMMGIFVPLDMAFVAAGIWGFDPRYVTGLSVGNLPIEEWLFFPITSYACVFIYECLRYYVRSDPLRAVHRPLLIAFAVAGAVCAITHPTQIYTSLKMGGAAGLALWVALAKRPAYLSRFMLMYLVSWVPFLLMNGVLTGSFIEGQVVWYSNEHILGVRIGTIPVEDSYYSLFMLLTTILVYEWRRSAA